MACQDIREDVQAYLDNELSPARRAMVESHLHDCDECRKVVEEFKTVSAILGGWSDAKVGTKFRFTLEYRMAGGDELKGLEPGKAKDKKARLHLARRALRLDVPAWLTQQWKPVAVAAALLVALTVIATRSSVSSKPGTLVRSSGDIIGAFAAATTPGEMADASAFAMASAKRTLTAQPLDPVRVASNDLLYAYLACVRSDTDQSVGKQLINLLASDGESRDVTPSARLAALLPPGMFAFCAEAQATEIYEDPLFTARQYEMQGRLKEAVADYSSIRDPLATARVKLAEGALRLRLQDYDGAEDALREAVAQQDKKAGLLAEELLAEVAAARSAAGKLDTARARVITTAEQWNEIAVLEVAAYDFRNAASSFMKAVSAAGPELTQLASEARFRSAWCDVASGQISTGIYGFRSIGAIGGKPSTLEYAASLEQAIGLARIGKAAESIDCCKQLLTLPAPSRQLEALVYFQKGTVELRELKDINAACESLGRVSSAGRGSLSYAAQVLLERTP